MKITRFKQVLSLMLCALLLFGILPVGLMAQVAAAPAGALLYNDFEVDVATINTSYSSPAVSTGNAPYTASYRVNSSTNITATVSDGSLNIGFGAGSNRYIFIMTDTPMSNIGTTYDNMVISWRKVSGTIPNNSTARIVVGLGNADGYAEPNNAVLLTPSEIPTTLSETVIPLSQFTITAGQESRLRIGVNSALFNGWQLEIDEIYFTKNEPAPVDDSDGTFDFAADITFFDNLYNDFTDGLGEGYENRTLTGNDDKQAYLVNYEVEKCPAHAVTSGVLHLDFTEIPGGSSDEYAWFRTANTIRGLENYRYMVLRMKGSTNVAELPTDILTFKFGTLNVPSRESVTMKANQLTSDYSDVYIEIPDPSTFYITPDEYEINLNFKYGLWISSNVDGDLSVDIDKIYFTNSPVPSEYIYHNFDAVGGLGADEEHMVSTGNGEYEACAKADKTDATWSVADGALKINADDGQWLRTHNTIRGLKDLHNNFNYMVLRMKAVIGGEMAANLIQDEALTDTDNVIALKFGSSGTQSAELHITAGQITDYYSDVYVEIPDNYYAADAGKYVYGLWIGSKINGLALYIDYIYFTNEAPPEEDDTPEPAFAPDDFVEKYTYNDFEDGLGTNSTNPITQTRTGNGKHTAYAVTQDANYLVPNTTTAGVLNIKNGEAGMDANGFQWLRTSNTITGLEDYHYMYLRIKGTSSTSTERLLAFKFGPMSEDNQTKTLYMPSSALTDGYTYVRIDIPNPRTYYEAVPKNDDFLVYDSQSGKYYGHSLGYRYCLWIGANVDGRTVDIDIDEIFFSNNDDFTTDLANYTLPDPLVYAQYTDSEGANYQREPWTYDFSNPLIDGGALTINFIQNEYGSIRYHNKLDRWEDDASAVDRNLHTKYDYMVLELEGGNALDYTTDSSLFQITFGGWDNSSTKPIRIYAEDIIPTRCNTVVLALDDGMFEDIGHDNIVDRNAYKNDVIIQQSTPGNNLNLAIKKIYFTNNLPDGFDYASVNRDVMNGGQPVDICDLVKLQLNINKGEALPAHEISISDMDKNQNVNAADADYMHKLLLGLYTENYSGFVYADFTNVFSPNVFTEGNNPTALNADGTLTRLASGTDSDTSWENTPGVFNVTVKQSGIRLRNDTFLEGFYNPNFYSNGAYQYTYMRIVLKGSAYDSNDTVLTDPNQNLFEIYFGNSANSVNSQNVKISQIAPYDGDTYTTLVFTLTNMFYNNAGRPEWLDALNIVLADDFSKLKLSIDEITLY